MDTTQRTVMTVPRTVYQALRAHLKRHKLDAAILPLEGGTELLNLDGLGLTMAPGETPELGDKLGVSSLISQRDGLPRIELQLNGELTQMTAYKAREIVTMLQEVVEAAMSDLLIYRFLTERLELDSEKATQGLLYFRELRAQVDTPHPVNTPSAVQ